MRIIFLIAIAAIALFPHKIHNTYADNVVIEKSNIYTVRESLPAVAPGLTQEDIVEIECLQKNIYFEAAVESTAGKLAVAHVTYNRVKSSRFPDTMCGVIYDGQHLSNGKPILNRCQFSWYCNGLSDIPYDGVVWKETKQLAEYYYKVRTELRDPTDGALFYHANYILPKWSKFMVVTAVIDTHIFYK
jgi:spore germination cell wall hydrolase CwlJ-like protein